MSKRMKKFFGAAMATVMMFAMSATAFAAGSPVASGTVNTCLLYTSCRYRRMRSIILVIAIPRIYLIS